MAVIHEFDYIVVGGGSGGSFAAHGLQGRRAELYRCLVGLSWEGLPFSYCPMAGISGQRLRMKSLCFYGTQVSAFHHGEQQIHDTFHEL